MLSFVYVFMAIWLQWIPTFLWVHLPASVRKRLLHTFAFLVCNNRLRFPASNSAHAIKNQHWYYWICEFYENVSFLKYQKSSAERVFQKVIVVKKAMLLMWPENPVCLEKSTFSVKWTVGSWFSGLNVAPTLSLLGNGRCFRWNVSVWEPNGLCPKLKQEVFFLPNDTAYLTSTFHLSVSLFLCLCQCCALLLICCTQTYSFLLFFLSVSPFFPLYLFLIYIPSAIALHGGGEAYLAYLFIGIETVTRNPGRLLCIQSTWK